MTKNSLGIKVKPISNAGVTYWRHILSNSVKVEVLDNSRIGGSVEIDLTTKDVSMEGSVSSTMLDIVLDLKSLVERHNEMYGG